MANVACVLCPLDFSDASQHAMDHAVAIAGWYGARVVALHVQSPLLAAVGSFAPPPGVYLPAASPETAEIEQELAGCLDGARRVGLRADAIVKTGGEVEAILSAASSESADLIVMGTHGVAGFEHLVLGSTTEKVLRKARCPVLTIPPRLQVTSSLPYKRVLCAVDFSDCSRAALELAMSLAHEATAALTLLHVIESPTDEEPIALRSFNVPEYTRYHHEAAKAELAALLPEPPAEGWRAERRIGHGKPYREILRIAAEDRADVIVMGVHGRNALEIMLFGSTTNQVVRRATCPVLTLRT